MSFAPQHCAFWASQLPKATSKSAPALRCFLSFDFETCFAPQGRALFERLNFQKRLPKALRHWGAFWVLTSKRVLRHKAVHFLSVSTSKSDFQKRSGTEVALTFRLQHELRATALRILSISTSKSDFQKRSGTEVLSEFWLRNVFCATRPCTFWASQLPKALWHWGAFWVLTSKRVSRHKAAHFLSISTSKSDFQKRSGTEVLSEFWVRNVLCATRPCTFWASQLPKATSKSAPALRCFLSFDFETCFAPQGRALFERLNFQKRLPKALRHWGGFNISTSTWASRHSTAHFEHLNFQKRLPKALRHWGAFWVLTSKRVLRHKAVHFLSVSTSKSAPALRCFLSFDFETCFAPQGRALFEHLNFQKRLPKALRHWGAFWVLTSKCASRHNPAQRFISQLARWLRTRRFSKSTCRPSWATSTFSRTCILFLLALALLWAFFFLLFSSLTLPTSALSSAHIVGSSTPKLPSTKLA